MSFKPGVPRPNHRQSDLDLFIGFTDQQYLIYFLRVDEATFYF